MTSRLEWHPEGFLRELKATIVNKLEESGEVVRDKAKSNCPVKTGRLRDSITSYTDKEDLSAIIYTDVSYAPYNEYGHKIKGSTKTVPPNPFMRNGLMESINRIRRIFARR